MTSISCGSAYRPIQGTIVVATDGSEPAEAAIVAARCLATRSRADVQVLAVLESPMPSMDVPEVSFWPAETGRVVAFAQRVRDQVDAVGGDEAWARAVERGDPPTVISQLADERGASLIVTGMSRHTPLEMLFGAEVPVQVAQRTHTPLLVSASPFALPKRVLVAVDVDGPGAPLGRVPAALLAEASEVYLAHVAPRIDVWGSEHSEWRNVYETRVRFSLERAAAALPIPEGASVTKTTLEGNPATEFLRFADRVGAELMITGRRSGGLLRRLGRGFAMRLLRESSCSVLIVPDDPSRDSSGPTRTIALGEQSDWAEALQGFTRRNIGRRARLDIDERGRGVHSPAQCYPFLGIDYDPHKHCVHIMLGSGVRGGRHLMHSIEDPSQIDLLGTGTFDLALGIIGGRRETHLSFVA